MNPTPRLPAIIPQKWRPVAAAVGLFLLNAYICRELFGMEFMRNLDSNEGVFVALSRFFRENFSDQRWFPLFNGGVPIENAYQPLLPVLAAFTGWISGWSVERAFHFTLALGYCLGPVALFWFAWDWSRSVVLGLGAGLAFSLTSFAELLIPLLRVSVEGRPEQWVPLRLYNLIHYAEDPHNVALTLLPVALLFLRRAAVRPGGLEMVAAVVSCGAVVLANAFGAVDLAIGGICIVLALQRGAWTLLAVGVLAYLLICPWLPPSLIALIGDQWSSHGATFSAGRGNLVAWGGVFTVSVAIWWISRGWRPVERFSLLFAPWMCAFPVAYFAWGMTLVPQGNRYQLELEMALCLVVGCLFGRVGDYLGGKTAPLRSWLRTGRLGTGRFGVGAGVNALLVCGVLLFGVHQTRNFRHAARALIQPVEIASTVEYKIVHWLDTNMPGQRAMVSGDVQFLNNVLSNNPQLGGGHEPTVPNWMNRVAVYTINSGDGSGDQDTEYSIFWLKAFGVQAVTISGEKSREHYHATAHPHKFDGVLPVLWHEEDDTIFAVPQRSRTLAHVMPREAISVKTPKHGLDLEPVRAYVAALDDARFPEATLTWRGNSQFSVRARMERGQVFSVQETWVPGWKATVNGRSVPLHADGIGLMVAEPGCEGNCAVEFAYGVTPEAWFCRILCGVASLSLIWLSSKKRYFRSNS